MNIIAGIVRLLRLDPEPVNFKPMIVTLNKTEVNIIGKTLQDWGNDCLKKSAYPLIMIAQRKMDAKELVISTGGDYSPAQMRAILIAVAQSIEDNG